MKLFKLVFFILFMCSLSALAQEATFSQIKSATRKNFGEIISDGKITGYYVFYESDKVDRKNRRYDVEVLDENLKSVAKDEIVETKYTQLLETAYNGSHLLFKFLDTKNKTVSYRLMDSEGEISKPVTRETSKYELQLYMAVLNQQGDFYSLSFPDDKGFLDVTGIKEKDYGYQTTYITNDAKIEWTYETTQPKGILTATTLYSSADFSLLAEVSTPSLLSRDATYSLNRINRRGKSDFKVHLSTSRYNLIPHNALYDEKTGRITLIGEHYNKGEKSMKSESEGVFICDLDDEGKFTNEKYFSWDKEIKENMAADDFKEFREYRLYFHDVSFTKDGNLVAVGEQYRKQVSAGGVAMNALAGALGGSSDVSVLEIRMGDMVFIEINPEREINQIKIFDKKNSSVLLPKGYELVNTNLLGKLMAANGHMDFLFMQTNDDNSVFSYVFMDKVDEEGKMAKESVIQIVNYVDEDADFTGDQLKRKTKANYLFVNKAKPGHLVLIEYFRKEKKLVFKLEPINF